MSKADPDNARLDAFATALPSPALPYASTGAPDRHQGSIGPGAACHCWLDGARARHVAMIPFGKAFALLTHCHTTLKA